MSDYRMMIASAGVEFITRLPRRRQRRLLVSLQSLCRDPSVFPDFTAKDEDGRILSHLMLEEVLITYYVDHAISTVQVLDLEDTLC